MYDLVIIGAGWAGFNAALRAKELGLSACLIDANELGGTCLHRGCIPTKSLISSAKLFSLTKKSLNFGVRTAGLELDWQAVLAKKDKIIATLHAGMQSRLKGIDFVQAGARITAPGEIKADGRLIKAKFILIATGSRPGKLANFEFGQNNIISSDQALVLTEVPPSILIIGGGVIGCEFAALFGALGSQVTLVEKLPVLLSDQDREVSRKIETVFKKKGVRVLTGTDPAGLTLKDYAKVLVCVGRTPQLDGLGLEELGVKFDSHRIAVDDYLQCNLDHCYAAGDCTGKLMLAHYAAYQGSLAAENMARGNKRRADNQLVPACIFTDPQIASVGVRENDALTYPFALKVRKFDFRASGMAHICEETEGFIKIITEAGTDRILGGSILGPQACELIAVVTLAVSCGLSASQFKEIIFAHPTLSESLSETFRD